MSKDTLFEEMADAVTAGAFAPLDKDSASESLPVYVQWRPIHAVLVDYCVRAAAREARRIADAEAAAADHAIEVSRANQEERNYLRARARIRELERRPTASAAAAAEDGRDAALALAAKHLREVARVDHELTCLIYTCEHDPGSIANNIRAIRNRTPPTTQKVPRGTTAEALARAWKAFSSKHDDCSHQGGFELDGALLEAVHSLSNRMDSTEGDAFNILKALRKLEADVA